MKSLSIYCFVGLLVLLCLTWCRPAAAQAPPWQTAQAVALATTTAGGYSTVTATACDAAGNVFVAGYFTSTVVLGTTTLSSFGSEDIFVAKFSPVSNQFVWAQQAGGPGNDYAFALAVSGSSVFVAGSFGGSTARFGGFTLTNAGSFDAFVAKLTDAGGTGSFAWAQRGGGTNSDEVSALAVSGASVYVAGNFFSSVARFGTSSLTNAGGGGFADAFVVKFTDAGNLVWAQQAGGPSNDYVQALAVNGSSVYVAGSFESYTASFGATTLAAAGGLDAFVARLTDAGTTGSFTWAQRAGGIGDDRASALAVTGAGVYATGRFGSPTGDFGTITLTSSAAAEVFVAKLTDTGSAGSFVWVQQAGGTGYTYGNTLAVSGTDIYIAGAFYGPTATFGTTALLSAGGNDVFVAKLTDLGSAGSMVWARQAGGPGNDYAYALAVRGTEVYVVGDFAGPTASFGATTVTNPSNGAPLLLGFLASLADATTTATAPGWLQAPAQLYPNPASHAVTLRGPAGGVPAPLTLCDALGRPVRHYCAPATRETVLDLRGLPAGLYLLRGAGWAQRLQVK